MRWLKDQLLTKENLWALLLCLLIVILVIFSADRSPLWIYQDLNVITQYPDPHRCGPRAQALFPGKLRRWALLVSSIIAIYWLQPSLPIRQMDFWFPTATLGLVMVVWGLTAEKEQFKIKQNWLAAVLTLGTVLLLGLLRFVSLKGILTASRPPQFLSVAVALVIIAVLTLVLARFLKPARPALTVGVLLILVFFVLLKNPTLATRTSAALRGLMSQDPTLALSTDLGWLGFSYVAFRLIHTMIDRMNGRLKEMGLDEVLIYTIFFPSFMAGPLDKLQRFRKDLDAPQP